MKRQEKERKEKEERENLYADSTKVWQAYILPNWNRALNPRPHWVNCSIRDPATRVLWWKGIPSAARGIVWQKCFGNGLAVTEDTFTKALERVKQTEQAFQESSPDDETSNVETLFQRIELDSATVFRDLKFFQPGGPLYDDLVMVTKAYALYRSDFAYVTGTHAVVATLLVNLDPFQTFVTLVNSLNRSLSMAFLNGDQMMVNTLWRNADDRNINITSTLIRSLRSIWSLCTAILWTQYDYIPPPTSTE